MDRRPLLALTVGDPAGIGPEIAAAVLADRSLEADARLLVIGPKTLRPADVPEYHEPTEVGDRAWLPTPGPDEWELGRPQASCGRAALHALRRGAELASAGRVDALVTGPVSKEALHLAGEHVEGQSELLVRWADAPRCQMMAVGGGLRVLLLTRHLPLAEAIERIEVGLVREHLALLDETMRSWGFAAPRLALAGLNPHAGEGGLLGRQDTEILAPAVAGARGEGIDVVGPLSPDTVFGRAAAGAFDAVLALYHDQAFIPVKLLAPDTGVTVLCGLPYLRVSPVHGTAFDIAGRGQASPDNLKAALRQAAAWASGGVRQASPAGIGGVH
jgi:4-hydroxythreonine-4-phosphate dehydrogenase